MPIVTRAERLMQSQATETCTRDEAQAFRKRLRAVGLDEFVRETIEANRITAKKLLTAFGIRPPPFLESEPDVSSIQSTRVVRGGSSCGQLII